MQVYVGSSRNSSVSPTPLFVVVFIVTSLFLITCVLLLEEKAQYSSCTLSKSEATLQEYILLRYILHKKTSSLLTIVHCITLYCYCITLKLSFFVCIPIRVKNTTAVKVNNSCNVLLWPSAANAGGCLSVRIAFPSLRFNSNSC